MSDDKASRDEEIKIGRRRFLKISSFAAATAAFLISNQSADLLPAILADPAAQDANEYGMLITPTQCIGCMNCVHACKSVHDGTPGTFYTDVMKIKRYASNAPILCMHCEDPPCATACLTGAITKLDEGPVTINQDKCIGCKFCVSACPFHIPQFDPAVGKVRKCDMCQKRIADGLNPQCVDVCPVEARYFGTYEEIIAEGTEKAQEIGGILIYSKGTSTVYVAKREHLEELEKSGINLPEEYPAWARSMTNLARYSRFSLVPFALGIIGHLLLWTRRKTREPTKTSIEAS